MKKTLCIAMSSLLLLASTTLYAQDQAERAESAFQAQQWHDAVTLYATLTEDQPSHGGYWFRLGQSYLSLGEAQKAADALFEAKRNPHEAVPPVALLVSLARAQAASDQHRKAIATLREVEATGARPFLAINNATEFDALRDSDKFVAVLNRLKPCNSEAHRAFDFWLGEWEVTSPTRPGWTARSIISLGNGGCSVHEDYLTQGGYAGRSINFFDPQKQKWHQTWTDNQGAPLYIEGRLIDGAMVLENESSRVTWSVLKDGRVRQHWQSTNDGGYNWTTAFDGYYERKASANLSD